MAGIKPGLERIGELVRIANPNSYRWRSIHVAGTNGKGSVCTYISTILHRMGIRCGTFTSPHLIHRHDCIKTETQPISRSLFEHHEARLRKLDEQNNIGASSFEILTATAFEVFKAEDVRFAVIEAGMGGELDATNVIDTPDCAVITKIGFDHQEFLGNTIEAIAKHKAGIIKPGGSYVVDETNDPATLKVIQDHATKVGAKSFQQEWDPSDSDTIASINQSLARQAVEVAIPGLQSLGGGTAFAEVVESIRHLEIPGRQQWISIQSLTGRNQPVLLDGAHNTQSTQALRDFVDHNDLNRENRNAINGSRTWLFAASSTKDITTMFSQLVKENDTVITTQFGPVEGMPWVSSIPSTDLARTISDNITCSHVVDGGSSVKDALKLASNMAKEDSFVIAGSLYLVGDVLRLLEERRSSHAG